MASRLVIRVSLFAPLAFAAASALLVSTASGAGPVVGWGADRPLGTDAASAIAAGHSHSCAIQAGSGAVVCWGSNFDGQASPPASVNGTSGTASAIAAGSYYTLAIAAPEPAAALLSAASLGSLLALARWQRLP